MIITRSQFLNNLKWLLTVFLLASFQLFDSYEWGKYSFLICSVLIYILSVIQSGWVAKFRVMPFICFVFVFAAFIAMTAFWSADYSDTLTMARTLLRTAVCFTLVYWAYMDEEDPYRFITIIVFASYIVAVYSVIVYGFNNIIEATDDIRLDNTYSNINSISLFLSLGFICDLYLILFRRFRIHSVMSILSFVIIIAAQSRKAAVFLVLGVFAMILFRFATSKNIGFQIMKAVFILVCLLVLLYFIIKLPFFSGIGNRVDLMINTFLGQGKMDTSSLMRNDLISLGFHCWGQRPIIGWGMATTHIFAEQYLYFPSYLHNNYLELLAGGGILCFAAYYSMHIYLIVKFFKIRKTHYQWFVLGVILIVLILLMDYGRVSYYSKANFFELMVLYLLADRISDSENRKDIEDVRQIS